MNKQQTSNDRGLRTVASVFANLTAILSANYIVFYILDHFNPGLHFVIHSTFWIAQHLHLIVAALTLITGVLYLILFRKGAFKDKRFDKKRLTRILIIDVLLAGAFAMAVNTYSFDWLHLREVKQDQIISLATLPPKDAPIQTDEETVVVVVSAQPTAAPVSTTEAGESGQTAAETPEPTEAPTPEPTPTPGLLGDR